MNIELTIFPEIFIIKPKTFIDKRGWFMESFRLDFIENTAGYPLRFCQDNLVKSSFGVLRGLHYQKPPFAQSKLVSVISGKVIDIIVDARVGSPNFGKYISIELSNKNQKQVFIPRGFAHGYICTSKTCIVSYKVDNYYNRESEVTIFYDDPDLSIDWKVPLEEINILEKQNDSFLFSQVNHFDFKKNLYD
ncbi:MAG: dTDP-4-dehydrorhamnose 3,5-epimerase [Flavobacteriaceae bacterium]|jgi:dTDP-4-dehydrorhamnose 3,5-epimerase|nr:dTDP-4-dehydrorhamnose 3,5-epimerase [Flavobacteriaceae bacterium]